MYLLQNVANTTSGYGYLFQDQTYKCSRIYCALDTITFLFNGRLLWFQNGLLGPEINGALYPEINKVLGPEINGGMGPEINKVLGPEINGGLGPEIFISLS